MPTIIRQSHRRGRNSRSCSPGRAFTFCLPSSTQLLQPPAGVQLVSVLFTVRFAATCLSVGNSAQQRQAPKQRFFTGNPSPPPGTRRIITHRLSSSRFTTRRLARQWLQRPGTWRAIVAAPAPKRQHTEIASSPSPATAAAPAFAPTAELAAGGGRRQSPAVRSYPAPVPRRQFGKMSNPAPDLAFARKVACSRPGVGYGERFEVRAIALQCLLSLRWIIRCYTVRVFVFPVVSTSARRPVAALFFHRRVKIEKRAECRNRRQTCCGHPTTADAILQFSTTFNGGA